MKANIRKLNGNFTLIGPKLSRQIVILKRVIDIACFETTMFSSDTRRDEVGPIIKKTKSKKSSGMMVSATKSLNSIAELLNSTLLKLSVNAAEKSFPKCLKKAKVFALLKKCDFSDPENYRPISVESLLRKVFVKLFCIREIGFSFHSCSVGLSF